jgi:heme exporter protein C
MTLKTKTILGCSFVLLSFALMLTIATPVKGLKDSYYLIFIHPPFAWVAYFMFVLATIFSVKYLRTSNALLAQKSTAAMGVGFAFIVYAAFSGMAWGQLYWGDIGISNKDPRFTSIIFVLIIYSAYFILKNALAENDGRLKLLSIYTTICLPFATFFIFIMPRIKKSLHPKNPILSESKDGVVGSAFGLENLLVLLVAIIGVGLIAHVIYKQRLELELLEEKLEQKYD